jgi:hypothetical protein
MSFAHSDDCRHRIIPADRSRPPTVPMREPCSLRLSVDSFTILHVSGLQFRTAARFADQHALGLRAGDALHLAICADHGARGHGTMMR